jgi:hypothetical protein
MEAKFNKDYQVEIEGKTIKEKIFQEELINYRLIEREVLIEDLINWISEAQNESYKYLMKEDLKYLINLKDEVVFSSISTNEYIAKSDNLKEFNNICKEILKLNKN